MEESSNLMPSPSGVNKAVLRVAWLVIGAGVLVALSAAITGGINPNANVLPIRNLAAAIMLIGLILVLGAYRAAWLKKVWEKSEVAAQASQPGRRNDLTLSLVIVLSILSVGAFFVAAVISLIGGIVSVYGSLLLRTMTLAALVSLLVYGKGYLRTFCLGAVLPVGLQAFAMFCLSPSAWQRSGFGSLENNLASLILGGVLAIAAGAVAMVARFLVENVQGPRQQQR